MEKVVLVVHLLTALAIIGMILVQQGKGADAGASFGAGASQTLFGSGGTWNFFSKATAILATLFFTTSFALAVIAKNSAGIDKEVLPAIELLEAQAPVLEEDSAIPVLESQSSDGGSLELPELEDSTGDLVLPPEQSTD